MSQNYTANPIKDLKMTLLVQSIAMFFACLFLVVLICYYDHKLKELEQRLQLQNDKLVELEQETIPEQEANVKELLKKYEQVYQGIFRGIQQDWR